MASESSSLFVEALVVLGAAVVAVPLFRRLGLSPILGYLAAGVAIGPYVIGVFNETEEILHFAELGVVLLLFIIGLELRPSRLWKMRVDILGLGFGQIGICAGAFYFIGTSLGVDWRTALVASFALALSSTAFALQMLQERGQLSTKYGQKALAILLAQDIAIIPVLALLPLLAFGSDAGIAPTNENWLILGICLIAFGLLGRFINPVFRFLSASGAREIMTAAALLIVFGAAAMMDAAHLSMGLGAFLAGVILSESHFRHELEANIEPFRGLLLALFFMAVGMSLDLKIVLQNWYIVLFGVPLFMAIKGVLVWLMMRLFRNSNADALRVAITLPQGGEFGFVLFAAAFGLGIISASDSALLAAIVTLSMAANPFVTQGFNALAKRFANEGYSEEAIQCFDDASAKIIVCGFGRFGQIGAQMLMAEGLEITAIDHDAERIKAAATFGFKIYYGDVTRPEIMRAAGADSATVIAICLGDIARTRRMIEMVRREFPQAAIFVRSIDRSHSMELRRLGVDYEIRETFESGIRFGKAALERLGIGYDRIEAIEEDVRERDEARLQEQVATNNPMAGIEKMRPARAPEKVKLEKIIKAEKPAKADKALKPAEVSQQPTPEPNEA